MHRMIALALIIVCTAAPASAQAVVATGVAEDATEANSQPKIAADTSGKVYLTFVKPAGGYSQIFVASSADGRRWALEQVSRTRAHARYPALAVGPDDAVHLAWTQYDGGVGTVYYARRTTGRWSTPLKISPGDAYAGIPALAVDTRGTVHMVWYGIRAGAPVVTTRHGSLYEILYTSTSGGRWSSPKVISPGIPDSINPALVIDESGRLHSAWYQFDLRNYQVRHTVTDRGTWTRPETVSSGRGDSMAVALAAGPGVVLVVWERRDPDGSRIDFAEHTQRWSDQQQLSPPEQRGFNPSVAVDARGRAYVAWDSDGQIYLRRRDGTWRETIRVTRDIKNTHPIITAVKDEVLAMWTQQIGDETRLRTAILAGGAIAPSPSRLPWGLLIAGLLFVTYSVLYATMLWRRRRRAI